MEGENRERWMRLCVEAADGQDSKRLLELISEIDRLLHEKEMRLRDVRREASRYVIEAAEKKAILAPQLPALGRSVHQSFETVWSLNCGQPESQRKQSHYPA